MFEFDNPFSQHSDYEIFAYPRQSRKYWLLADSILWLHRSSWVLFPVKVCIWGVLLTSSTYVVKSDFRTCSDLISVLCKFCCNTVMKFCFKLVNQPFVRELTWWQQSFLPKLLRDPMMKFPGFQCYSKAILWYLEKRILQVPMFRNVIWILFVSK